jgi:glycosyltransferase involved in cell wall biosynthesis
MSLARPGGEVDVTVLVPAKDEAENLQEFVKQFADALEPVDYTCELVVIDDGSRDGTGRLLEDLARRHAFLRVVTHRTQRGIAAALRSGGTAARGEIFVFYPADLQFTPAEIPNLVAPIRSGEADIVTGRKQGAYEKQFVSGIYNRLCRWLFGVRVTDLNAVKAYRRDVMRVVPDRPDWHRFMVVIAAVDGFRVAEVPVTLHPRRAGKSKFGLGRIPVGITDLLSVWFQLRFGRKPMLFFGVFGGFLFALGFLVGVIALILRFGYGFGFRPFLDLVMVLVITGVALFGFGLVGEMLADLRQEMRAIGERLDRVATGLQREDDE